MGSLSEIVRLFWFLVLECLILDCNRFAFLDLNLPESTDFGLFLLISLTMGVNNDDEDSDFLELDCLDSVFDLEVDWANSLLSGSGAVEI